MKLLTTQPDVGELELRAMTMVARAGYNGLGRPQVAMIDALQQFVLQTADDVAELMPVSPESLAGNVTSTKQSPAEQLQPTIVILEAVCVPQAVA